MNKLFKLALIAGATLSMAACASQGNIQTSHNTIKSVQPGVDMNNMMQEAVANHSEIHWVSVADIKKSLEGKPPMTVSFDFDDTLYFSSPVFYRGQQMHSPNGFKYLKKQKFWNQANGGMDRYSIPKKVAKELVAMHHARGDKLYVITGRTGPARGHSDYGLRILNQTFGKGVFTKVIYAGGHPKSPAGSRKTAFIKKVNSQLHYGDADEDIFAPHELNVRAIRFIRASNSTYYPLPKIGKYGEEVLIGSEK